MLALGGEIAGSAALIWIADHPSVQKFMAKGAKFWDEHMQPLLNPVEKAFNEGRAFIEHEAHLATIFANPFN